MSDVIADFELSSERIESSKIVVVDDEDLITSTLSNLLLLELDVEPTTFNDPREAEAYVGANQIDLIISDFMMPQLDGISLLRSSREHQPHVPRVLLTGYADKENAIKAINEVQLFQYVEKPWDNGMLINVIRNALERRHLITHLTSYVERLTATQANLDTLRRGLARAFA